MAVKGKQVAEKAPASKRKHDVSEKTDTRKRRNPGVLQFFDVAADVDEDDEESDDDDFDLGADFMDDVTAGQKEKSEPGKSQNLPFFPKEEELSDEELEMLLEERYKSGSKYVVYAEDKSKAKGSGENDAVIHSMTDPTIWRVKCTVGRERRSAFCLIQKFIDLQSLGNKLKIVSAFAPDHIKGYIYIEAEREVDVLEACRGLTTVYSSRISQVPKDEVAYLFSVRNTSIEIPPGTWIRVKHGNYSGDLAQVVAFDAARKSATVKIIPRIDLQALAKKLAGGGTVKQTTIPAARVISSRDTEELRPHIVVTLDRQTGMHLETIDGLKLKDGYLYKKVSIDSINYVDIVPTGDELLKFKPYKKDASDDTEWLSHLYGEQRKKRLSECSKGTSSKGTSKSKEGTSGTKKGNTKNGNTFQLHDLVTFGPKEFGVIVCVESDSFQILKYDEVQGAEVLNVELHEIMSSVSEKKFTTMDRQMKAISIKDTVRVVEGLFEGRQGIVKHICRGVIFIYDENQLETGGYFCAKSQSCEIISESDDTDNGNTGDAFVVQGFEDSIPSPKSPESSKKPWQEKENIREFSNHRQGDRDGAFSVGQNLRIRVGPLKGHLCRVVSIFRSDVTVKVDSQTRVLSVKKEHLSEAGVKSNFVNRTDGFGMQGDASGAPAESGGWNSDPLNTERSSWPDFSVPDFLKNPFDPLTSGDPEKEKGDDPWGSKATIKKVANSWGNAASSIGDLEKEEGDNNWGSKETSKKATDSWGNPPCFSDSGKGKQGDDPWGSKETYEQPSSSWGGMGGDLEKGKEGGDDPWGSKGTTSKSATQSWGNTTGCGSAVSFGENSGKGKDVRDDPWGSKETPMKTTEGWKNAVAQNNGSSWGSTAVAQNTGSWGSKGAVTGTEDCWNNQKGSDSDRGFEWKKPTSFDGGRGSGGRGGRGGSGGSDGGGKGCYKCGGEGHFARECPEQSGGTSSDGGGKGCFKCGGQGHFARECPEQSSGGGRSGDGGGKGCYKCGGQGHFARECPEQSSGGGRSGDGGGKGCYKCGGQGHFARECPEQSSDGGRGKSTTSKSVTQSWGSAVSFGEDSGKDVGDDPWGSKETPMKAADGWNNAVAQNNGSGWGSKQTSEQPTNSWGGIDGDLEKGKVGGDDPWGSKATTLKSATQSWGSAVSFGKDSGKGKDIGDDPWGSKETPMKAAEGWNNAVAQNNGSGWGSTAVSQNTGSWGSKGAITATEDGWNNQKGSDSDRGFEWKKPTSFDVGRGSGGRGGRGGDGGGKGCYKCGGEGHFARECPEQSGGPSGDGGGKGCFKCGGRGHFARECPEQSSGGDRSGDGGGKGCYKCGGQGHFARECTEQSSGGGRSGDGGGKGCYKCGGQGHFARECPEQSSGVGRSNATTSKSVTQSWGSAVSFGEDSGKGKVVGDDPWGSKETPKKAADGWNNAVAQNNGSGWGSKDMSEQPTISWGGIGGDLQKGKEGGDDPWGSKGTTSKSATQGCGSAVSFGEDSGKGKDVGDDPWGSKETPMKAADGWINAVAPNSGSGWGSTAVAQNTGHWGNKGAVTGTEDGWNNQKGSDSDRGFEWKKPTSFGGSGGRGGRGGSGGCDGGGKGCYKCGGEGHFARECPEQSGGRSGDGGGKGCFKCGGQGHFARECPEQSSGGGRSGDGGGKGCYKCGGQGHFARECPEQSSGGGRSGDGGW